MLRQSIFKFREFVVYHIVCRVSVSEYYKRKFYNKANSNIFILHAESHIYICINKI